MKFRKLYYYNNVGSYIIITVGYKRPIENFFISISLYIVNRFFEVLPLLETFNLPDKEKYIFYIYDVIVKQKKKRSVYHYSYRA